MFFIIINSSLILLKLVFFTDIIRRNQLKFIKMAHLPDFKRSQIVGARLAGASVTKTDELFGSARSIISKGMKAFDKEGKASSLKQIYGRKRKLSDRALHILHNGFALLHKYMSTRTLDGVNQISVTQSRVIPSA